MKMQLVVHPYNTTMKKIRNLHTFKMEVIKHVGNI